jgi:ABC-type glycerol-3-phosphate transport system substrate-binding protein
MKVRGRLAALGASAMFVFAACSVGGSPSTSPTTPSSAGPSSAASSSPSTGGEPVTITWYHIQNNDPGLSLWKALAEEY